MAIFIIIFFLTVSVVIRPIFKNYGYTSLFFCHLTQGNKFPELGLVAQSVARLTQELRGPRFHTQSGHILSFLLPLTREKQ